MIRDAGARPILALRAETDYSPDMDVLIDQVEWVSKLTVNPGYSGQKIQEHTIGMIEHIRDVIERNGFKAGIQADGNINPRTIPSIVGAGADILTGGTSGLFIKEMSLKQAVAAMHEAAITE